MANRVISIPSADLPSVAVEKSSSYRNSYTGRPAALVAAGVVTPEQLQPQVGRMHQGRAEFNADGTPYPAGASKGGWRNPGHKTVVHLRGGAEVRVEITIPVDEQEQRKAEHRSSRRTGAPFSAQPRELTAEELLPAAGRFLNRLAEQAGIGVVYDELSQIWTWHGTAEVLQASGLFTASVRWDFQNRFTFVSSEGIAGDMRRNGEHIVMFCKFGVHGRRATRAVERAQANTAYQSFRRVLLAQVDGLEMGGDAGEAA